eukprot:TRINITY_DN3554_c0_g2_i1.p1 TRINITY_DN3554_c0_g2~~TRINITY_DN3554_c0_g2_i1.p1  ORF type:complete len:127 (-),score=38.40 TRINITY_DN3554_c0_g2_i1:306-686(-)
MRTIFKVFLSLMDKNKEGMHKPKSQRPFPLHVALLPLADYLLRALFFVVKHALHSTLFGSTDSATKMRLQSVDKMDKKKIVSFSSSHSLVIVKEIKNKVGGTVNDVMTGGTPPLSFSLSIFLHNSA